VLDLDGGRITGVSYGSQAPLEKQLGDLRLPVSEKTSLTDLLGALRGARLEIRSGTTLLTGRLLNVEPKTRISVGVTQEVDYVSVLTDSGEVRTTEILPSFSVRLLERGLTDKVERYLDLVSAGRQPDTRRLAISTDGSGERSVFVSYISEVPVWKSTWRIVLDPKRAKQPLLQGWAIVDNTVGEDWNNVDLSLVAGAPQSFIQNLSQPYYTRRPEVPLAEAFNFAPQTHEATLISGNAALSGTITDPTGAPIPGAAVKVLDPTGMVIGQAVANASGQYAIESLPPGAAQLQVAAAGFNTTTVESPQRRQDVTLNVGATAETVTVSSAQPKLSMTPGLVGNYAIGSNGNGTGLGSGAQLGGKRKTSVGYGAAAGIGGGVFTVDEARARAQAAALAQAMGDLFEYKLRTPISIRQNQSALVPIVQAPVTAEKVSLWNDQSGIPKPQRALWLTNSSGLTLDGGSFSVLDEETFAGEGIFDPIRPGERRLLTYAIDLGLTADSAQRTEPQRVVRVRIDKGVLTQQSEVREKKTYTFRNEDTSPRTVVVEHPVRTGYKLRSVVQPAETTADWMRFRLEVAPKQTAALEIEEARPLESTVMVSNITDAQVAQFVEARSIDKSVEAALRRVLAQKAVIEELDAQKSTRENAAQKIYDDQQRVRENMKALQGSAEEKALLQRYTQQLNEEETRLAVLETESEQIEAKQAAAQAELDHIIQSLSFDVTL